LYLLQTIIYQKNTIKRQATKIGIYVPLVVNQKKPPQRLGKMVAKAPQELTTFNFVVKRGTIITPVENVMQRYI
jgi:hypothetical protein